MAARLPAAAAAIVLLASTVAQAETPIAATGDDSEQQRIWWFLNPPLGDPNINDVVIDPDDDSLWYVTSSSGGLYITRNSSGSWEQHLSGPVGAVALDPRITSTVGAGAGSDLYGSGNSGATWSLVASFPNPIPGPPDSPTFIDSLLVSAIDGTVVVGLSSQLHSARVYKSVVVGGALVWQTVWESPHGYHIWDIAEDPVNGYWFFCTEDSQHAANPVVMRSTNRGASWEEMTELTGYLDSGHGLNIEVHPVTRTVYFLTESSLLYISNDSGDSWSPGIYVDFGAALTLDPSCPNRVFGGEMIRGVQVGGASFSETGGQSFWWVGPANNTISSLALNNASTAVVAVSSGAGLWYQDFGSSIPCTVDLPFFADGFNIENDLRRWGSVVGAP